MSSDLTSLPTQAELSPINEKNEKVLTYEHAEPKVDEQGGVMEAKWDILRDEANRAEEAEHSLSFWQAAKIYKAVSVKENGSH